MLPGWLIIGASFAYLLLLFAVAYFGDRRADQGRSIIDNPWVFSLSLAVYCTAWTYFGSVGRAASGGTWFLPTYLGPTLGLALAWLVVLKMIRIARSYRITSIADFVASRYGKSHLLGGLVTLIAVVGGIVALSGLVFYESSEHFARRIDGFLSPEVDPRTQLGYAANAIQEGGFFGVGVGEGPGACLALGEGAGAGAG